MNALEKPTVAQKDSPFGLYTGEENKSKDLPWKMLLYGDSGSGKTFMSGTFPDPIFLDLENGMRSVAGFKKPIYRYPADTSMQITDFAGVKKFYSIVSKLQPQEAPFKTIVIDSLNELQVLILRYITGSISGNRQHEDQPTYSDYGKLARDMQQVVRQFFQLPYHVIFTGVAIDREYEEEKIKPQFIGKKSGPDLRRIIEQIGYCYTARKDKNSPIEHLVAFEDSPQYLAKDRTNRLRKPIQNTYDAMMAVVNPQSPNGKEPN